VASRRHEAGAGARRIWGQHVGGGAGWLDLGGGGWCGADFDSAKRLVVVGDGGGGGGGRGTSSVTGVVLSVVSSNGRARAGWTGSTDASEGRKRLLVLGVWTSREWRRRTGFVEISWSGDFGFDKRRERSLGWVVLPSWSFGPGVVQNCGRVPWFLGAVLYLCVWANLQNFSHVFVTRFCSKSGLPAVALIATVMASIRCHEGEPPPCFVKSVLTSNHPLPFFAKITS
jgi:hypothetical protein